MRPYNYTRHALSWKTRGRVCAFSRIGMPIYALAASAQSVSAPKPYSLSKARRN